MIIEIIIYISIFNIKPFYFYKYNYLICLFNLIKNLFIYVFIYSFSSLSFNLFI